MKQEQDNYCYLFTLASTNKATLATLKTLYCSYHLIHTINLFLLLYFNLQDDNGIFRLAKNASLENYFLFPY